MSTSGFCVCGRGALLLSTATALSTGWALWSTYRILRNKLVGLCSAKHDSLSKVNAMMVYHYAPIKVQRSTLDWLPDEVFQFHQRCADLCVKYSDSAVAKSRVLDVGCGVGRTSFELARHFDQVIGLDNDASVIAACQQLKQSGRLLFSAVEEGDICSEHIAEVDSKIDRSRIQFGLEDVTNLPSSIGKFGCILVSNFLCQVSSPKTFINDLKDFLHPEGILVIGTTYVQHGHKPVVKGEELGGVITPGGTPISGFDALQEELGECYDFLAEREFLMGIRSSSRSLFLGRIHVTVWQLKKKKEE